MQNDVSRWKAAAGMYIHIFQDPAAAAAAVQHLMKVKVDYYIQVGPFILLISIHYNMRYKKLQQGYTTNRPISLLIQ